ncbi:uncharacterized protein LOC144743201 [Ciona intestinalis]
MEVLSRPSTSASSFDYIMSKKVSELTQVVHMLFSRNHERELEIKKTQEVYNHEINRLKKETSSTIEILSNNMEQEFQKKLAKQEQVRTCNCDKMKNVQQELEFSKQELLKEQAINASLELKMSTICKDLDQQQKNLVFLKEALEQTNLQLNKSVEKVEHTTYLLKVSQESSHEKEKKMNELKIKYAMMKEKFIHAQNCIDLLKQDLNKSKANNNELRETMSLCEVKKPKLSKVETTKLDRTAQKQESEDIVRLQNEIQWLRMELNNREGNLNKVFSRFQPVFVSGTEKPPQRMMMVTPVGSNHGRGYTPPSSPRKHLAPKVYHRDSLPFQDNGLRFTQKIYESQSTIQKSTKTKDLSSKFRLLYTK